MKRFWVLLMVALLTFGIVGCSTNASGKVIDDKMVFKEKFIKLADRANQSRKSYIQGFAQNIDGEESQGIVKMNEAIKEMTSVHRSLLDLKVPDQYKDIHSKFFDAVRLMLEAMQTNYDGVVNHDESKLDEAKIKFDEFPYNWDELMSEVKNLK